MDSRARLDTGMCLALAAGPSGLGTPACCSSEGDWGLEPDPRKRLQTSENICLIVVSFLSTDDIDR